LNRSVSRSDFQQHPELDPDLKKFSDQFFLKFFPQKICSGSWHSWKSDPVKNCLDRQHWGQWLELGPSPLSLPCLKGSQTMELTFPWTNWQFHDGDITTTLKNFCPTLSLKNPFHVCYNLFLSLQQNYPFPIQDFSMSGTFPLVHF
jgi:hypothetical protein